MDEIKIILMAILKSLIGIAFVLCGIMVAVFQGVYVAFVLSIIGMFICIYFFFNAERKLQDNNNDNTTENHNDNIN